MGKVLRVEMDTDVEYNGKEYYRNLNRGATLQREY